MILFFSIGSGNQFSCVCLHGDRSPQERKKNLEDFKAKKVKFLICTDVAARGLDIKGKFFSKVKFSLEISTTFEFSRQKVDTKLLGNDTFQSIPNLKWWIFNNFEWAKFQF